MKQPISLQKRIITSTLAVVLLTATITGVFVFQNSYEETEELFDEQLKSVATAIIATNPAPQSYPADDDDGLWIEIFAGDHHPYVSAPLGFYHFHVNGDSFQIYQLKKNNTTVVVRQRTEAQDELATMTALYSLAPLLLVNGVLLLLLPFVLWYSFRSVRGATRELGKRDGSDLSPLTLDTFPKEIHPFAHAINDLLAKTQDDITRQKRFIADASHELRSPLTAISLQVQRLQTLQDPDKLQAGLDKLSQAISQNQALVEKLLTLTRLSATLDTSSASSLPLKIKETVNLLLPIISDKALQFDSDIDKGEFMVYLDATALLLLIKNIIQNAVLYTPKHGQIHISLTHNKHKLQDFGTRIIGKGDKQNIYLQIKDSGIGVNPDDYVVMFEPFKRLSDDNRSDSSQSKGTGLGLSMVKSICEQGQIDLYLNQSVFDEHKGGICVTLVF